MSAPVPVIHATFGEDSARTRRTDPIPSHEAADSNTTHQLQEDFVLELLTTRGPMNDWELTKAFFARDDHPYADMESPRKRRSDLVRKGQVLATAELRPGRSGRRSTVWTVRPELAA
jgi:hypothetical protein